MIFLEQLLYGFIIMFIIDNSLFPLMALYQGELI